MTGSLIRKFIQEQAINGDGLCRLDRMFVHERKKSKVIIKKE